MTLNRKKIDSRGQQSFQPVYKSETLPPNNSSIKYKTVLIDTHTLCDAVNDQEILIQLFEWKQSGSHVKKGQAITSLAKLFDSGGSAVLNLGGSLSL